MMHDLEERVDRTCKRFLESKGYEIVASIEDDQPIRGWYAINPDDNGLVIIELCSSDGVEHFDRWMFEEMACYHLSRFGDRYDEGASVSYDSLGLKLFGECKAVLRHHKNIERGE